MPAAIEQQADIEPVRISILVEASPDLCFRVYTEELNAWWPRTHHIGSSPMLRAVLEPGVGGRVYSEQQDGSSCQWGQVLAWDPPHRFTMAWQVTPQWQFEPDPARCSEVEVTFTAVDRKHTEVTLEHRHFKRHGEGAAKMRSEVGSDGGWNGLMKLYKAMAEQRNAEQPSPEHAQ